MNRNYWELDKVQILQYFLIYIMFISSRAVIYAQYQSIWVYVTIFMCIWLSMKYPQVRERNMYIVFVLLLGSLYLTRWINGGGYGMDFYLLNVSKIWVTYVTVHLDREKFLERFVRLVVFFAGISLIMWIAYFVAPNIVERFLLANSDFFGGTKGMLLYTFRYSTWMRSDTRNVGIFTEPGIYQIVLNSAIYMLVFMNAELRFSNRKMIKYLLILLCALVSSQSTTGFISLGVILLGFLVLRKKDGIRIRTLQIMVLCVVILLVDYSIEGKNSIIYNSVISKLSTEAGQFDLNVSTGFYRMNGITTGWEIFLEHPLGAGDNYETALSRILTDTVASGVGIIRVLAVCGIITFILFSYFNIIIAKKMIKPIIPFIVYLLMWINTGTSQSDIVYSCLLCIVFVGINNFQTGGVNTHEYLEERM